MDWADYIVMLQGLLHWWIEFDHVGFQYEVSVGYRGVLGTGAFALRELALEASE